MNTIRGVKRHNGVAIPDAEEKNITYLAGLGEVEGDAGSVFSAFLCVNKTCLATVSWNSERSAADEIVINWHHQHGEADEGKKTEARRQMESCLTSWAEGDFDLGAAIVRMRQATGERCCC
jgi:hypothetical protein